MQVHLKKSDFFVVTFALLIAGGLMYQGIVVLLHQQESISNTDFK